MFQLNKPDFISTNTAGNVLSEMSRCCHHVNSCRNTRVSLKYSAVSQQTGYKDIRVSSAGGAESRAGLCSLTRIVWCDNEHEPLMFIYYLSQLEQNLQLRKYTLCALCETFTCCCVVLCCVGWTVFLKQIGAVWKFLCVSTILPAHFVCIWLRSASMKTAIKDPSWAILVLDDCHTAGPEEFIPLQLKHCFLACCHLDLLSVCNFLLPVVQTKRAAIILDGATFTSWWDASSHRSLCLQS